MTAREIAHHLKRPSKCGSGWSACCPAHPDKNPSLTLVDSEDGKVLAHCHAGCDQRAVIHALRDLGLWEPLLRKKSVAVAEYDYRDAQGKLLYQVVRTEPKGFFQRRPDGYGGWINRGPRDDQKILYQMTELIPAPILFLVEGERDVETLRSYGFVGTTNVGGAKAAWLPQYTEALRAKEVIVVPDRDDAGYARARRLVRALQGAVGRLVYLDLGEGKDITEWFGKHSELELMAHVEEDLRNASSESD